MANINDTLAQIEELGRQGELTTESLRALMEEQDDGTETLKKLGNVTVAAASSIQSFTSSVASGNTSFTSMNGAITGFANALGDAIGPLGLFVKAGGKLISFAIERMQDSFTAFQDLADAGAIGAEGISGLRDDFGSVRIPIKQYAGMLKKNAKDLSVIYGSSLKGSKEFAKTMTALNDGSDMQLRSMGFTIEQISDTAVGYQKTMRKFGFEQTLTSIDLRKATVMYGKELDMLTKITGESKAALQSQKDEMLSDSRFRATSRELTKKYGKENVDSMTNFIASIKKTAPKIGKGMQDMISGVVTDNAKALYASGAAPEMKKIMNDLLTDQITQGEARNRITKLTGDIADKFQKTAQYVGDIPQLLSFSELRDLADKGIISEEQLLKAQRDQALGLDDTTNVLVDANANLQKASADLDLLATSTGAAVWMIDKFTWAIESGTSELRKAIGLDPLEKELAATGGVEGYKDAIKEREDKTSEINDLKNQIVSAERKGNENEVRTLKKQIEFAEKELASKEKTIKFYKESSEGRLEVIAAKEQELLEQLSIKTSTRDYAVSEVDDAKNIIENAWFDWGKKYGKEKLKDKELTLSKENDEINKLKKELANLALAKEEINKADNTKASTVLSKDDIKAQYEKSMLEYKKFVTDSYIDYLKKTQNASDKERSNELGILNKTLNDFRKENKLTTNGEMATDLMDTLDKKFKENPKDFQKKEVVTSKQVPLQGPKQQPIKVPVVTASTPPSRTSDSPIEKQAKNELTTNINNNEDIGKIIGEGNKKTEISNKLVVQELQNIVAHLGILNSTSQEGNKKMGDLDNTIGRSGFIANNNTISV